ncbi:MAG: hypothetical protein HKM00_02170, partial [Gallionella sp.]|nr:hypothetical protein [Gallionella sp.]
LTDAGSIPAASTITLNPNPYRLGFFCPQRHCWRGSGSFSLERNPATNPVSSVTFPVFCPLFSVFLLSVQEVASRIHAGFRLIGYDRELVECKRPK